MNFKTAIITGSSGMDFFYLASLLLSKDYKVIGLGRRNSTSNTERLQYIIDHKNLILEPGDLTDFSSIERLIKIYQPDEFYNLAAMSHVRESFDIPITTANITGIGALHCLEAIRLHKPDTKFYQASSSELFGNSISGQKNAVLNENSLIQPRSPYACAKAFAHWSTVNYAEAYKMHASAGILFNHTSPLRGESFVERKITKSVALIKHGLINSVSFGNLESKRDFGFSGDYMEACHIMLQQEKPGIFAIGTGIAYSPLDILHIAADALDIKNIEKYIKIDENLYRPTEVDVLICDSQKAQTVLGWKPKIQLEPLIERMAMHDAFWFSPKLSQEEKNKLCRPLLGDALAGGFYERARS